MQIPEGVTSDFAPCVTGIVLGDEELENQANSPQKVAEELNPKQLENILVILAFHHKSNNYYVIQTKFHNRRKRMDPNDYY
mmetsp:Transcript_13567/g.16841  ORF Transcript_13567/g.16841 Transcript_13567/m.16841 type:complete len:81 (+) Transcript_13567:885-1127(+)